MANSLVKAPVFINAKYINATNDSQVGGAVVAAPSGVQISQGQQTLPGDRIVVDDATALALSATATGTLYGGIYMYVQTLSSSTAAPAVGTAAFFRAADVGVQYMVTADGQPSAAVPAFIAGVFVNAITKGNYGWIQLAGVATVQFDAAAPTDATAGRPVFAKISPTTPGAFDSGISVTIATTVTQLPLILGTAIETPTNAGLKKVLINRGLGRL